MTRLYFEDIKQYLEDIKRNWWAVVLLMLMLLYAPGRAQSGAPVALIVDGHLVALVQPGIVYQGRVMVPLRGVLERLGATVSYDLPTRAITAERADTTINLALGSRLATVNGHPHDLDVPPLNMNGRVLVPLRFVSETMGAKVNWQATDHTVSIMSQTGGIDILNPPAVTPPIPEQSVTQSRLINAISVVPQSAVAGQTVTVTMMGSPGGTATMTLGNVGNVGMQETAPGKYVGTYVLPAGMEGKSLDITTHLSLPGKQPDSMTNMSAISIGNPTGLLPGGILPIEIITPNPAAKVSQVFDLAGRTQPNALVRLTVLKNKNDEILSTQTFADAQGDFHFQVDTAKVASNTHLIVKMRSEDTSGKSSQQLRMELTRE